VQFTPPGSQASIQFGHGRTTMTPGSLQGLLQEITQRLPGRVTSDVPGLAELLHETAEHHGAFEAVAPPHDWWDWYAAYLDARQAGATSDDAAGAAGRWPLHGRGQARRPRHPH
jgi:hypothetical protein